MVLFNQYMKSEKKIGPNYRTSSCSFRGNYYFLNLKIVANSNTQLPQYFNFLLDKLNFCCGNYSREVAIKGRKLYEEIRYFRKAISNLAANLNLGLSYLIIATVQLYFRYAIKEIECDFIIFLNPLFFYQYVQEGQEIKMFIKSGFHQLFCRRLNLKELG